MSISLYGMPYMGSKQLIADKIISIFPKADNFYDLFGGGFSITQAMLVRRPRGYSMILTYRFRLKDQNKRNLLKGFAGQVNLVWNTCNEAIRENWRRSRKYTNKTDLNAITRGASKEMAINSQTIQAVSYEVLKRTQLCKKRIRFRTAKRCKNLGWVPFNGQTVNFHGGYVDYNGFRFRLWQHRSLPESAVIKTGSFAEDARGRWYVNLVIEIDENEYIRLAAKENTSVGIDPGLKTVMTTSDGEKFERDNLTRAYEIKLANAQRHKKKKLTKKIHAKIKNRRLDFSHKASEKIASEYELVFFGDVSSKKLAKTRMAKGVADAAWGQVKTFLAYKTVRRRGRMLVINEKFSTVTCSTCFERTGPSGLSGLKIREWECCTCGSVHDRDVNSARNILRLGHETLNVGSQDAA